MKIAGRGISITRFVPSLNFLVPWSAEDKPKKLANMVANGLHVEKQGKFQVRKASLYLDTTLSFV